MGVAGLGGYGVAHFGIGAWILAGALLPVALAPDGVCHPLLVAVVVVVHGSSGVGQPSVDAINWRYPLALSLVETKQNPKVPMRLGTGDVRGQRAVRRCWRSHLQWGRPQCCGGGAKETAHMMRRHRRARGMLTDDAAARERQANRAAAASQ